MDKCEEKPVSFLCGGAARALRSRRGTLLQARLPSAAALRAAVAPGDSAWARCSPSFWLISTDSVCLTRQERENLCRWGGQWGKLSGVLSVGHITTGHHGGGQAGSERGVG